MSQKWEEKKQQGKRCEHPDEKNNLIEDAYMDMERLIAQVLPQIAEIVRSEMQRLSVYDDEAQTHAIMQQMGHIVAQVSRCKNT